MNEKNVMKHELENGVEEQETNHFKPKHESSKQVHVSKEVDIEKDIDKEKEPEVQQIGSTLDNSRSCSHVVELVCIPSVKFMGIFILWALFHNTCATLYASYCGNLSFFGILNTMVMSQSPHCRLLRHSVDISVDSIYSIWGVIALWGSSVILYSFPKIRTSRALQKMREYHMK